MDIANLSVEFQYFILFSVLLLVPKILQRFSFPTAITALFLGIITTLTLGWFQDDQLVLMLSRLGITSLFLFAGMEVEIDELRKDAKFLSLHLLQSVIITVIVAICFSYIFTIQLRPALLLALGIMSPSTGFILNSLNGFDYTAQQKHWIRSKAISAELVAIVMMFFVLQTESVASFAISTSSIIAMILILPLLFKFFIKKIAPFARDSEVNFLVLIALLCGVITTKLGTYYLVGAFIVGMTAGRFRHFIAQEKSHNFLVAISFFFTFFVPFYFYKAGMSFPIEMLNTKGAIYGAAFLAIFLPLRIISMKASIWFFLKEQWQDNIEITFSLLPTLIFGLVMAMILQDRFNIPPELITGLLIYTVGSSIIPSIFLKKAPKEAYDSSFIGRQDVEGGH